MRAWWRVILYVDDEPGGEWDRSAANRMYEQADARALDTLGESKPPEFTQSVQCSSPEPAPPSELSVIAGSRALLALGTAKTAQFSARRMSKAAPPHRRTG